MLSSGGSWVVKCNVAIACADVFGKPPTHSAVEI
ncbi:hypothetical protein BVRB_9g210310 [Beta vulgaris subsp. vulgaris]|nr:hypothetical protein BVRB_9g210310 [Beta vulgaris subsp. vulgaris]